MMLDLAPTNPYGLTLHTPVIAAAGSLGYGVEYARLLGLRNGQPAHGIGALVTRTTTLHAQRGAPHPRIVETPAGLLYSGTHNPGLRTVLERYAPTWASWELPVLLSIAGANVAECAEVAARLEGVEGVAGVEVSLAAMGCRVSALAAQTVAAVRGATLLPLLVKLPPDAHDIVGMAQAVVDAGADALSLVGALPAMAMDPASGAPIQGWLCGPALRPLALSLVAAVAQAVSVPIIGGGGIASAEDARQFRAVGASAVSIGAALLVDPRLASRIAEGELKVES